MLSLLDLSPFRSPTCSTHRTLFGWNDACDVDLNSMKPKRDSTCSPHSVVRGTSLEIDTNKPEKTVFDPFIHVDRT